MRKLALFILAIITASSAVSAQNNDANNVGNAPAGFMSYSVWQGKVSVNGTFIDNSSTHLYFSPEAESLYKSGNAFLNASGYLLGFGIGYPLGYALTGGGMKDSPMLYVCLGCVAASLPVFCIGKTKINKAVSNYNSSLGSDLTAMTLNLIARNDGFGLVLTF